MNTQADNTNLNTYQFGTDIDQLMSLIINAFYSKKEIFLRELLSNASDALEKQRFTQLTNETESTNNLKIKLYYDKDLNTITVEDNGIGMTKDDLINSLGTIAKSGTKTFMEKLKESKDINSIGQFGVGFYSSFLVADNVEVITKNENDLHYRWSSNATSSYTIDMVEDDLIRGTKIILHLKEEAMHYMDDSVIRNLVKQYSQYIIYPIELLVTKEVEVEEQKSEEVVEEQKSEEVVEVEEQKNEEVEVVEEQKNEEVEEVEVVEEQKNEEVEVVEEQKNEEKVEVEEDKKTETIQEWEKLNEQFPIWTKEPVELKKEDYDTFYKNISGSYDEPLFYKHFKVEGKLEFKSILYVPEKSQMDMFQTRENDKNNSIKLYVKRVFIMDNCDKLLPDYLKFLKGVVDSEDLNLNVSREILQETNVMKVIKSTLTKKAISMFEEISQDKDKFNKFNENYGKFIKLGIHEDSKNRERLSKLLRFQHSNMKDELIGLEEYVSNMKEGQDKIYYISGESVDIVDNSPFVEKLKSLGYDVLYFVDVIDEYMTQHLNTFNDKKLVNITKDNLDIDDKEETKILEKDHEELCKWMNETLNDSIENVKISTRLKESPCVLVSSQYGWSSNMERIMKSQAMRDNKMDTFMSSKKILEINPNHKIIKTLKSKIKDTSSKNIAWLLYETALINSGFSLKKPRDYADRIHRMIEVGFCPDEVDDMDDDELPDLDDEELPDMDDDELDDNDMEKVD